MKAERGIRKGLLAGLILAALAAPGEVRAATYTYPPGDSLPKDLISQFVPGDTLIVPPGSRKVSHVLPTGITVLGEGSRDSVIFHPDGPGATLLYFSGEESTRVENITFDCGDDQLARGLYFHGGVIAVRGNRFVGGHAIEADSTRGLITENAFERPRSGIRCVSSEIWIDRNEIIGAADGAIGMRGSPLRITRNRIVQSVNTGIVISGKRFAPVIGGEPGMGNEIHGGFNSDIFTTGGKDINAQYNYWGLSTTEEMNRLGYPANIAAFVDGWDQGKPAGKVDYRNWLDRWEGVPVDSGAGGGPRRTTLLIAAAILALVGLVAISVRANRRRSAVTAEGAPRPDS